MWTEDKVEPTSIAAVGGEYIAVGTRDGSLQVFSFIETSSPLVFPAANPGGVIAVERLTKGLVVSAGADGCVAVWDLVGGKEKLRRKICDGPLTCACVKRAGQTIVVGSAGRRVVFVECKRFGGCGTIQGPQWSGFNRCGS